MKVKNYVKLILFAILSFFGTTMAYSASPIPFTGREQEVGYISQQTGSTSGNVKVRGIDLSDGTIFATYENIYPYNPNRLVNAFAYNNQDNFMYAIRQRIVKNESNNNEHQIVLERIGKDPADSSKLLVETITGPLATSSGRIATSGQFGKTFVNTGTIDFNGNMYIIAGNQDKTYIYKINTTHNISPNTTNDYIIEQIPSGIPNDIELGDWAYNHKDGRLYFVNRDTEGSIWSMSTSGGGLKKLNTKRAPGLDFTGTDIVGVFFDDSNNLYIYNTKNGRTFKVDVSATEPEILPYIDDLGAAGGGDGARNISKPVTPKPDITVTKDFVTGDSLPVYDDTNKVLKLKYRVTIQNNNNLVHPNMNLTDLLEFTPALDLNQITFEAISLPPNSALNTSTGAITGFEIPGNKSITMEFYVNVPYSLITSINNNVLNTVIITNSKNEEYGRDDTTGTFEVKEIVFLDKKLVDEPKYNEDGTKATAIYEFTVVNPLNLAHAKLSVKDLFVDKNSWEVSISKISVGTTELTPDADGNVVVSTAGIGALGTNTINVIIEYDLSKMTTTSTTLYDYGQVSSYIKDPTNGVIADTTEQVETPLVRTPGLSITKEPGEVKYNTDGTADIIYTFTVTNKTNIAYSDLTIVDKIIDLDNVTIDSVISGIYDPTNKLITISSFTLAGNGTKVIPVTVKYNLNGMITRLETVTDKGYIYDTSEGKKPGTGTDNDGSIGQTEEVTVDFTKTPVLTINKSKSDVTYNEDGTASVEYTFSINNPTLIPTSVTVVDKVLSLGNLKIINVTYEGASIGINNNLIVLPPITDLVGSRDLKVTFKYNLSGMTTTLDSATDKAFLYDNTTNPDVSKDPEESGQVNIPSEEVKVDFEKLPSVTIEKKASTVNYNIDGTAEVVYTFTVNNPTLIPYKNLTIVDKIISLEDLIVVSAIGGAYDSTKGTITLGSISDFTGTVDKTVTIKYDTNSMVKEIETATDKAYLYDTSEGKVPGTGLDNDENILDTSDVIKVDFTKEPQISISKSASAPTYNDDGTASVIYTFTVNNPTLIPTSVTVVDKIKDLDELTIESIKDGENTLTMNNNVITLPEIVDLVGEKKISVTITYNLNGMTSISNSVTNKAFAYSDSDNPYVPGNDPESDEEKNKNTPSEDVTVPIAKSPAATIEKSKGEAVYNDNGTADVIYTFTIKNSTLIAIENLELKDKIYDLEKITINSVVEVLDSRATLSTRSTVESEELETYTIWNLGTISLPGGREVVKKYKVNYNLDGMETTSQTVKNVGIINIDGDENPLDTSNEVDTILNKDPKASILKTPEKPVYNEDGTVGVTYTFAVKNETNIPYDELTVVDKIVDLNNLTIASVQGGVYDKNLGVIVLDSKIENLLGLATQEVTVTVTYNLDSMTTTVDTTTDKAFLYDTSEGKEPGTGSDDESNPPVGETEDVIVEVSKEATIEISKSSTSVVYNSLNNQADVTYKFIVQNLTNIPYVGVTIKDTLTDLGDLTVAKVSTGWTLAGNIIILNDNFDVAGKAEVSKEIIVTYNLKDMTVDTTTVKDIGALINSATPNIDITVSEEVSVDLFKNTVSLRQDVFNVTDNYQGLFTNLPSASEKNLNPLSVKPSSELLYFATLENSNPAVATNVTINTDHTLVKDTAGANVFTTLEIQGFVYAGKNGSPVEFKSTDLNALKAKLEELGYKVDSITPTEIKFSQVPGDSKLSLVLGAIISPDATFSDNFAIENFASLNGDDPKSLTGDDYELRRTLVNASLDKIEVDKSSKTPIYDPNLKVIQIPYEIKVTNTGSTNLKGLILEDVLVPGLSELGVIKDITLTNGTVNESGETIQDITINVGDIWTVNFILEVTFDKVGDNGITIENTAVLKKGNVELGKDSETVELKKYSVKLRNDVFTIDTNIINTAANLPTAELKNSKPPVVKPGSNVLYFVTLTNENNGIVKDTKIRNDQTDLKDTDGSNPAFEDIQFKGVIITDTDGKQTYLSETDVDKLVTFLESSGYQTSVPQVRAMRAISSNGAVGTETTNFATVPANSSVTFVLDAKVNSAGTFKQNYEIVNFSELNDDNPKNNLTGDEYELRKTVLLVGLDGDLVLQKVSEKDEASVGKFVPYTITVKNNSTATVTNIYIKDNIPSGFVFVKDSARIVDNLTNTSIKVPATGGKEVIVGPIESIAANSEIQITYLLKVGVGVKPGKYTNTAVVVDENKNPLSNQDSADVDIVPDELFDTTTIIGKVFHDRDEDGIQDYAMARGVIIEINLKDKSYVNGSSIAKQYGMSIPVKDSDKFKVDLIDGRISEAESPLNHMVTIRKQILRPDAVDSIRVTTKDGTDITLHSDGKIVTKHTGDKKAGMTSQDIQIGQKILKNKKGEMFVEIYVANNGIQEEGIPGVRLATVEGLVMETDKHGRYHLPPVTQEKGKNLIIKVDPATLPKGSVFTTENPRVRHLGRVIMKFNFGVKLPELQEVYQPLTPTVVGKEVMYK